MSDELIIKIKLDSSQAKQGQAEIIAGEKRIVESVQKTAEVKAKADKEVLTQEQATAKAKAAIIADINKQKIAAAKMEMQAGQQVLTQTQVNEQAKSRIVAEANAKRVAAAKAAMQANQRFSGQVTQGLKEGSLAAISLAGGFTSISGALGAVIGGMGQISEYWKAQRKDIEDSVDRIGQYRKAVLELASLKGDFGQAGPAVKEQLDFRDKTLQTRGDAIKFNEGAMNTGASAVAAGLISQGEFDKALVTGGSYQAAMPSLDPEAWGNLMGIIPSMRGGKDQKGDDVTRHAIQIAKIFDAGGSSAASAVKQFAQNSALIGPGMYKTDFEGAAVQTLLSLDSPNEAGTLTKHLLDATAGSRVEGKGSQDGERKRLADYWKGIGATDQMSVPEMASLAAADQNKKKLAAEKAGKQFNLLDSLTSEGFTNHHARQALMGFINRSNTGQWGAIAKMADPANVPELKDQIKPVTAFRATPEADAARSELMRDQADAAKATPAAIRSINANRQEFESLRSDPDSGVTGTYEEYSKSLIGRAILDEAVKKRLIDNAKKSSVDTSKYTDTARESYLSMGMQGLGSVFSSHAGPAIAGARSFVPSLFGGGALSGNPLSQVLYTNKERQEAIYGLSNDIRSKGGDPSANQDIADRVTKGFGDELRKHEERQRAAGKPPATPPPMPPGRRADPNARP